MDTVVSETRRAAYSEIKFYDFKTDVHLVGFNSILSLMMHGTMNVKNLQQNLNSSNLLPRTVNTPFATFQITSVTLAIRAALSSADILSQNPSHATQEEK
jgi:hypothetical protein